MKLIELEQGSDEWHSFREQGIGASEIGAIMGVCPYRTILDIYQTKIEGEKRVSNVAIEHGNIQEPFARKWLENTLDTTLYSPCAVHDELDFIRCSFDGINIDDEILVEIKSPYSEGSLDKMRRGHIPLSYIYQVQWQMMIAKFNIGFLAVWDSDEHRCHLFTYKEDRDLWEKMELAAHSFWECVKNKTPPEDPRYKNISKYHEELKTIVEHRKHLVEQMNIIKKEIDGIDKTLEPVTGGESVILHGMRWSLSEPRKSYDIEKMKEDGIDVDKYVKIGNPFYKKTHIK